MASRFRIIKTHQIFNFLIPTVKQKCTVYLPQRLINSAYSAPPKREFSRKLIFGATAGAMGIGLGLYSYLSPPESKYLAGIPLAEKADFTRNDNIMDIKPSREVSGPASALGLDLTLYQYQTCPFCCKVRAFLEFYGIPYKVIEVNPVMRQQLKFSKYKKVPILIVQEKESPKSEFLWISAKISTLGTKIKQQQLNDSTVIISILGSLFLDLPSGLDSVLKYYVPMTYKNEDGKEVEEVMNKYFLMFGDNYEKNTETYLKKERQWRKWADNEFVHLISPNIYRTYDEALQAFNYFSEVGEWEKNFSMFERLIVIYVGATAMYFVGKRLKKKYSLKEDVRQSLYDGCKLWMKEIGSKRKFMGGEMPNLADLAMYGILSSFEGCVAFQDLINNTNIGPWYYNVKEAVTNHYGYQKLKI
ncbi:prostaglandin E synthase 2 [Caerostris extrusa]|uniref:Prostaglandin E synthase 2 n=1 Tax=Caerostris extrusa TaxID=172846 RepID=A0AAV4QNH3_CAEEX|nr:prostaglandin E synthase 2 [Caerostris extrusa]